ncbi:hypothetical protein AB0H43_21905 [Hamadaea sp. NPDC050747]|uniref:hypothetical protein n=1 Tax=Hamadaea sp. NPDC050747 TaxID=3155789 RepID=UPI0033EFBB89
MALSFEVVTESLSPRREQVIPGFVKDTRFNTSWWCSGSAKSPVSYCRFLDGDVEVARAKVFPGAGEYRGYTSWACPVDGATEIDLIEVRFDLRRSDRRYGRQAVEEIAHRYGQPVVAMSLDETSDGFWRSLAWTAHLHPDDEGHGHYRTLFTSV